MTLDDAHQPDELERLRQRIAELERQLATAQAADEFKGESQLLCRALDAVPIPVLIAREDDGSIVFANSRVEALFHVAPERLVGRDAREFYVNLDDRRRLLELLAEHGHVWDYEVQARGNSSPVLTLLLSLQPITYIGLDCVMVGMVDVTRRKEAEQSLVHEHRLLLRLLELQERDRQLIGFEIHDGIVQQMTAVTMFLESASVEIEKQLGAAPEHLTGGIHLLRECIDEARRLIGGLQPPVLDEAGVIEAIQTLAKETVGKGNVQVALDLDLEEGGLGEGLAVQAPKGHAHLSDEDFFNGVGGGPLFEMGVDDGVVEFGVFAGEDEGSGVGSVECRVEGGSLFAFGSFWACGFEGVLAGCVFAFVVGMHAVRG